MKVAPLAGEAVEPFTGTRPYLATGSLHDDDSLTPKPVDFDSKPDRASVLAQAGDVIFARMKATTKVLEVTEGLQDHILSSGFAVLRPNRAKLSSRFLFHYLRSPFFQARKDDLSSGATQKAITNEGIAKLLIPIPPEPESLAKQSRIAAILDKADELRRKHEESIRLMDELPRSTFLEMFGDPVRNPKRLPLGRLGDVAAITGGLQVTSSRAANPISVPYLRVANVYRDRLNLSEVKAIRVTPTELSRCRLVSGDVLIVEGHGNPEEIGRSAVWTGKIDPCVHQNHLIRVRLNRSVADPAFVSAYLNSLGGRRQLIRSGKTTSGLNTISTSNVKAVKIPLPDVGEQACYRELVKNAAVIRSTLNRSRSLLDTFFQSLLHRAFRGEL